MNGKKPSEVSIKISCENIDEYIEKANRLVQLLTEAKELISSLRH